MRKRVEEIYKNLFKYFPEQAIPLVVDLLESYPVHFKVTRPRKTLLGSYTKNKDGIDIITVNGDLNPYAFLITLVHEFAHLVCYRNYGNRVAAHGKEWQNTFKELLHPFIEKGCFPEELAKLLKSRKNNLTASQCTDMELYTLLKKYDKKTERDNKVLLKSVKVGSHFLLEGRVFEKIKVNRTRAVCRLLHSVNATDLYTVSLLAEVELIKEK